MSVTLLHGSHIAGRREAAIHWLNQQDRSAPLLVVGKTVDAGQRLLRDASPAGPLLGWQATTLEHMATAMARRTLLSEGQKLASPTALDAIAATVIFHANKDGALGRFHPIALFPGSPRALARTLDALRLGGVSKAHAGELGPLLLAFEQTLTVHGLADRASLFQRATEDAPSGKPSRLLFFDAPLDSHAEQEFVRALITAAPAVLGIVVTGDRGSLHRFESALASAPVEIPNLSHTSLARLQARLFESTPNAPHDPLDESVTVFSAPGETRECLEIARSLHAEADRGIAYDRMAVALHSGALYRAPLEEALRRAGIPFWARAVSRPDPAGRALLSLLGCAAEGLSAARFAEYLSLDQLPLAAFSDLTDATPDDDSTLLDSETPDLAPDTPPTLRRASTARRFEAVLVDALVIGGAARWPRRLAHLREQLDATLAAMDATDPLFARTTQKRHDAERFANFALPLIERLASLPASAPWAAWIDHLEALASSALRQPATIRSLLRDLVPLSPIGPVTLTDVRLALRHHFAERTECTTERPFGRVLIGTPDALRGLAFDVVFVPGLAERVFPTKVLEDPLLQDHVRLPLGLKVNPDRIERERVSLRIAVGAAMRKVVLSWSRLGTDENRPRVPSFYGLEALRAATGVLPSFDELIQRAQTTASLRLSWPAPDDRDQAIDDAEFDLATLGPFRRSSRSEGAGAARYLVERSPILARALRSRWHRWSDKRLRDTDGLIPSSPLTKAALALHALDQRSYSPTALENFAHCPYRFALNAIFRLRPKVEPKPMDVLDPLSRGSLIHDVQYRLLTQLEAEGALPVTKASHDAIRERLDRLLDHVAARFEDDLAPAIPSVFKDAVDEIRSDLFGWLRRLADDPEWTPRHFELSFGLTNREARDASSQDAPLALDCGITLRGAIDLIEQRRDGTLRATDYKTGKVRPEKKQFIVSGGASLQPVLYALAAEKMLDHPIASGTLYFCTHRGGYETRDVPLNDQARKVAEDVALIVGKYLRDGLLPAAPERDGCRYCDYVSVCGPSEEQRMARKTIDTSLDGLRRLRSLP